MTKLVGILNITPDSFSDGGDFFDAIAAIVHLERLWDEGADMVDIGAESTRPGATPLSADEEWERLKPFFATLTPAHVQKPLSLDTRHPKNAKRALDKGYQCINDVSGFANNEMIDTLRGYNAKLVVMHSLSVPADKNIVLDEALDVVQELSKWYHEKEKNLTDAGIARDRIIFDPGIGFGKTAAQSLDILARIGEFKILGVPLYIGHSRKSFLKGDRNTATLAWSKKLMQAGADFLRVHDVAAHVALRKEIL